MFLLSVALTTFETVYSTVPSSERFWMLEVVIGAGSCVQEVSKTKKRQIRPMAIGRLPD